MDFKRFCQKEKKKKEKANLIPPFLFLIYMVKMSITSNREKKFYFGKKISLMRKREREMARDQTQRIPNRKTTNHLYVDSDTTCS